MAILLPTLVAADVVTEPFLLALVSCTSLVVSTFSQASFWNNWEHIHLFSLHHLHRVDLMIFPFPCTALIGIDSSFILPTPPQKVPFLNHMKRMISRTFCQHVTTTPSPSKHQHQLLPNERNNGLVNTTWYHTEKQWGKQADAVASRYGTCYWCCSVLAPLLSLFW